MPSGQKSDRAYSATPGAHMDLCYKEKLTISATFMPWKSSYILWICLEYILNDF